MGSILRAVEVPPSGGDTLFADMYAVYEGLDDATPERWAHRAVQHYASSDYWPARRVMERATIIGDRPV